MFNVNLVEINKKHHSDIFKEILLYDLSEPLFHLLTEAGVPLQQPPPPVHPLLLAHSPLPLQDGRQLLPVADVDERGPGSLEEAQRGAGPRCAVPGRQHVFDHGH